MTHLCHATGCKTPVPPRMFMCRPHWLRLPHRLRNSIWRAYRPGQEIDKKPSDGYLRAAAEAISWLAIKEGRAQPPVTRVSYPEQLDLIVAGSTDPKVNGTFRVTKIETSGPGPFPLLAPVPIPDPEKPSQ